MLPIHEQRDASQSRLSTVANGHDEYSLSQEPAAGSALNTSLVKSSPAVEHKLVDVSQYSLSHQVEEDINRSKKHRLPCDRLHCNDPFCDREHPEEPDPVYVGECTHCGRDVFEADAVVTKGKLYHEDCADRLFPYDYGDSVYPS